MPPSGFVSYLVKANQLERVGFDQFVFFQGMLFNSFETWWEKNNVRKFSHEGVDLCFFMNGCKGKYRLDESVQIPLMYTGKIVCLMDDFLGKTIIVRHPVDNTDEPAFFSFYAHMKPRESMKVGDVFKEGEIIGTIADVSNISTPLASHLHLSMAWEEMLPPVSRLNWEVINRADRSAFIDPLEPLNITYSVLDENPDNDTVGQFTRIGSTLCKK